MDAIDYISKFYWRHLERSRWKVRLYLPRYTGMRFTIDVHPNDLNSYSRFQLVCAREGLFVQLHSIEHAPRCQRRARWLEIVADAINAGDLAPQQECYA